MSDKHAHYSVSGSTISRLVRICYILADRESEYRESLIRLAQKLVSSPMISYDDQTEDSYTLDDLLESNGLYLESDEDEEE